MDFIKEWTYTICITLIVSVIFSVLSPKGNIGKFYKIILSMFIFFSFIIPFANENINISLPEMDNVISEQMQEDSYSAIIKNNVLTSLENGGYSGCVIDAGIRLNDSEISINRLKVYIPDSYDKDIVSNYLYDNLGIVAEVYYIGE